MSLRLAFARTDCTPMTHCVPMGRNSWNFWVFRVDIFFGSTRWSGVRESNPPLWLGKRPFYRWTNPAFNCVATIAREREKCNRFLSRLAEKPRYGRKRRCGCNILRDGRRMDGVENLFTELENFFGWGRKKAPVFLSGNSKIYLKKAEDYVILWKSQ